MLPFADASFDVVVSAFVLRNLADIDLGLREMRRILRPGGVMAVLDFGMPRMPVLAPLYRFYFLRVLPKLGKMISGVEGPYGYLPASVQSFPPAEMLKEKAEQAGFQNVEFKLLTAGVAVLLLGSAWTRCDRFRRPDTRHVARYTCNVLTCIVVAGLGCKPAGQRAALSCLRFPGPGALAFAFSRFSLLRSCS